MNTKHRLLLVDDNPYVSSILVQTLKEDFYVTVVNTGQSAVQLFMQGNQFDCVLTELKLPLFSGLELTKLIRANNRLKHTPIVVLSNASDSDTRIECLEQGVDSYIAKPFNPLEVKARLLALLRRAPATVAVAIPARPQLKTALEWHLKTRILSMISKPYTLIQRM